MENRSGALLLIGNGFDKSINLPTGYSDFLESEEFYTAYKATIKESPTSGLFTHLKEKQNLENWVDVECELKKFALEKSQESINSYYSSVLRKDYKLLKASLKNYLQRISADVKVGVDNPVYSFLKTVAKQSFSERVINQLGLSLKQNFSIHNLHGSIEEDNLIFGISEVESERNEFISEEITFLQKSYCVNYNPTRFTQALGGTAQIYFYGVSLGESDSDYFKNYFKRLVFDNQRVEFCFSFFEETGLQHLHNRLRVYTGNDVYGFKSTHSVTYFDCVNGKFLS